MCEFFVNLVKNSQTEKRVTRRLLIIKIIFFRESEIFMFLVLVFGATVTTVRTGEPLVSSMYQNGGADTSIRGV